MSHKTTSSETPEPSAPQPANASDETGAIRPEYRKKPIRSYVIRAGRMTSGQKEAFDRWWPTYGLSLFDGPLNVEAIFGRQAPLVVEVGFGMGDSLLEMAQREPDKNFIGIEVHPPGVGRLIKSAGEAGLRNLRVYMADAVDVLTDCIPDQSISRFQVYFPDPWHKKKHHKRRLVQAAFINLAGTKIRTGGQIHLATDWENYAEWMLEVMSEASGFSNCAPDGHYSPRPSHRPVTKFEQRGAKLGHGVWDLVFERRR